MEKHFQSVALIRRMDGEQTRWLVKWDERYQHWKLVRSERLEAESFREVILREVAWELDLDRKRDFAVSKMPRLCMEYVGSLPERDGDLHIAVAFYMVPIYRAEALQRLESEEFLWINSEELCRGITSDDVEIDPQGVSWINRWEVVQPWTR